MNSNEFFKTGEKINTEFEKRQRVRRAEKFLKLTGKTYEEYAQHFLKKELIRISTRGLQEPVIMSHIEVIRQEVEIHKIRRSVAFGFTIPKKEQIEKTVIKLEALAEHIEFIIELQKVFESLDFCTQFSYKAKYGYTSRMPYALELYRKED